MAYSKTGIGLENEDDDWEKVHINFCSFDGLLTIPTVGETTADRIWDLRKHGDITPEILATVPHIKMHRIQDYIDYCTLNEYMFLDKLDEEFEDKCTLDEASDAEDTVIENLKKSSTPKTSEGQSEMGSRRLACSFIPPPAEDKVKNEVKTGSMVHATTTDETLKSKKSVSFKTDQSKPGQDWLETPLKAPLFQPPATSSYLPFKDKSTQEKVKFNIQPLLTTPAAYNFPSEPGYLSRSEPYICKSEPEWYTTPNMTQTGEMQTARVVHRPKPARMYAKGGIDGKTSQPIFPTAFPDPEQVWPSQYAPSQFNQNSRVTNAVPLKSLKFDGSDKGDDRVSFLGKFEMYAEMHGLSEQEKRAHLCWAMTGNAARFCLGRVRRNKNITYDELVQCMEKRFNLRKLTETVRIQFQSARQAPGEDLDDWAERLLSLADKAFHELPEEYVTSEVINKLCQGCLDKHAGSIAASFRAWTVDEALERIKWQQYSDKAVFGNSVRTRNTREAAEAEDVSDSEEPSVNTVKLGHNDQLAKCMDKIAESMDRNTKAIQANIGKVQDNVNQNLKTVQEEMNSMENRWRQELAGIQNTVSDMKNVRENQASENVVRPRKDQKAAYDCYNCGEFGHLARFCKQPRKNQPSNSTPYTPPQHNLNGKGSAKEA